MRLLKVGATLVVTGLCTAYILWKIDLGKTGHVLAHARVGWWLAALAIMVASVWPMAWRWQRLLAARGVHDPLSRLVRRYSEVQVAGTTEYGRAISQAVSLALEGRVFNVTAEFDRRLRAAADHALGGAATLTLAVAGFALAVGRYSVGGYLWVELAFVVATVALGVLLFSTRVHGPLRRVRPLLRALRVERPLREVYLALHSFRNDVRLLTSMFALTLVVQAVRVLAIWCSGKAVGVDLSPRPYYVMGPLLFLVALVPFTVNGLAVRESFFVSFLGALGVAADPAFATGFLFFVVTIALALPGAGIVAVEALRAR